MSKFKFSLKPSAVGLVGGFLAFFLVIGFGHWQFGGLLLRLLGPGDSQASVAPSTIHITKTTDPGISPSPYPYPTFRPGDLIPYHILVTKDPGPNIDNLTVSDCIDGEPVIFNSASPANIDPLPPPGCTTGVAWDINPGNNLPLLNALNSNSSGTTSIELDLYVTAQDSGGCFLNIATGLGTILAGGSSHQIPVFGSVLQVCIFSPRFPYLKTTEGDVEAGGLVVNAATNCDVPGPASGDIHGQQTGQLHGPPTGTVYADYVVAAYGGIGSFDSQSGDLLGQGGGYHCVPKPDPVSELEFDKLHGLAVVGSFPGASLGDKLYELGSSQTWGGNTNIQSGHGTIYIHGDLTITGNVQYAPPAGQPLPALGVVVTGSIYIAPNVGRLDGLYWAGSNCGRVGGVGVCNPTPQGMIDTCGPGQSGFTCRFPLVVNGMLMADKFRFARTYYGVEPPPPLPPPAETVNYLTQAIADPPPGFLDTSSSQATLPHGEVSGSPRF